MFHLHSLGWHSFQELCLTVLREVLGQTVESFLDGNDAGQDGAFTGTWRIGGGESLSGKFVFQCKFTSRPGYSLRPSDIADELPKVDRLVRQGVCNSYVLITNAGVSGETNLQIKEQLRLAGVAASLVLGQTWIEQQIRMHKNLRMMVPRVYGLGDLSQILDARAYEQAKAVLRSMRDDLAKVVLTESYRKAAKALSSHHFVLLIGEPAAGKTTVASMLAMASADKWGASIAKVDSPKALVDQWNPEEKSQFFWIDDAFGVMQYESALVAGWNHVLPQMKSILDGGSRIVMTSRDYIYKRARQELKEGAFPLFRASQTIIDVHDLSGDERKQILYNHLKLGRQGFEFRSAIKPFLPSVANHRRFIPEIARRLSEPLITQNLHLSQWSLDRFVDKRENFLEEVCEGLDADCKAALALVYMRKSKLLSPIDFTPDEEGAIARLNSSLGACTAALGHLEGSLVVHSSAGGDAYWSFKHPTIGDAFAALLRRNPELLGIYVRGTDIDKLVAQVSCGDVEMDGAVVLPRPLYGLVIDRLRSFRSSAAYKTEHLSTWYARRAVKHFLAQRCSREFVESYIQSDPDILDRIDSPGLYLEFSEDVDLAIRLFEWKLLPENIRVSFARSVSKHAWQGNDARVLNDSRLRAVLNTREASRLEHAVRTQLLPRIEEVRRELESDYKDDEADAEWHMRRFDQVLTAVADQYPTSRRIRNIVNRQRVLTQAWIEQRSVRSAHSTSRDIALEVPEIPPAGSRDIFDDIDA